MTTKTTVNWDAANIACTRHLPTVEKAVRKFTMVHPNWYIQVLPDNYPPRIWIRCALRVRGKTRRTTTGINIGRTLADVNYVQALSPTDTELVEIGDFIGSLATEMFTPRRCKNAEHPWVEYELRPDYDKFQLEGGKL